MARRLGQKFSAVSFGMCFTGPKALPSIFSPITNRLLFLQLPSGANLHRIIFDNGGTSLPLSVETSHETDDLHYVSSGAGTECYDNS